MTLVISGAADKKQIKQAVEKWIATLPASGQRLQVAGSGYRTQNAILQPDLPDSQF